MTTHTDIPVRVVEGGKLFAQAKQAHADQFGPQAKLTEKVVVNFIRHRLTPYDAMMDKTRKAKDGYAQREVLRKATLNAIAKAYGHVPFVVAEVTRQLQTTDEEADRRNVLYATEEDIAAYRKGRVA